MRAVLDHSRSKRTDRVAFFRPYNLDAFSTAHQQTDRAVVIGKTNSIFAVVNALVAGGGAGSDNAVAVLHQLLLIIPCLLIAEIVAHEIEHRLQLTPCGGGSGRVGLHDLALQFRLQQVSIAIDINAKLFEQGGVLQQAYVLIGEIGVVAVGLYAALVSILRRVLLKKIQVLVAVRLRQTAKDDVALRVFFFCIDTSNQFANGTADKFNLNVGIVCVEDLKEYLVVNICLGAVDRHSAGQIGFRGLSRFFRLGFLGGRFVSGFRGLGSGRLVLCLARLLSGLGRACN